MQLDDIVVGAGTAGVVVAARRSENPANRVLWLEQGSPDLIRRFAFPARAFMRRAIRNPRVMKAAIRGRLCPLPARSFTIARYALSTAVTGTPA